MLQPIIVRRADQEGAGFELISGERRLRAAVRLGWREIPSIVREADDRTMLTLALIENLQRTDLNVVEEATGYQRLQDEFQLTQHQIAEAVGKDRSTIANLLRLLALPTPVLMLLEKNQITMGHARALLGLTDERMIATLASEIVVRQLTVRDVERRIREKRGQDEGSTETSRKTHSPSARIKVPPTVHRMEDQLRRHFQTDVQIRLSAADKGAIELTFYSADDLERLMTLLIGMRAVDG
jgi:ParB family chromosome partitioning protein